MRQLSDYKVYVFDLDGTLYDQPKMRMAMAVKLMLYYAIRPHRIGELLLIKTFRSVKDKWDMIAYEASNKDDEFDGIDALDIRICDYIASVKKCDKYRLCSIIKQWIYEEPLDTLKKVRDAKLIDYIARLRDEGKKVIIYSDYPVENKLSALSCMVDAVYSSTDANIMELKPSPKVLNMIIEDEGVSPEDIIMIGDRFEKDGKAAINAGVDYYILTRSVSKRGAFYTDNCI